MRIMRIGLIVLAVAAAVSASIYSYLTGREAVPVRSAYALDIAEIRRLAESIPGPKPVRIRSELVAEATLPRGALYAGDSLREKHRMVHQAYQVVFPDRFLVLDAAFDAAMHAEMDAEGLPFHEDAFARVQAALPRADAIFITHEHGDHIRGIAVHPEPEALAGRLRLTKEQLANTARLDAVDLPEVLRAGDPLDYEPYLAFAPGVVLVKAAGHTPGSQLLYVALADGNEFLFIGDVAWHMDAIRRLHYRPRLVTDHFLNEDRRAVLAQFRALHDLDKAHPEVQIVVSHDPAQRKRLQTEGRIGARFE